MPNLSTQEVQPQFTFEGGHLVMYHQESTALPQTVDATVNDRDRMTDLLAQEKYLTHGYNVSMLEASNERLFRVLKQNHDGCHQVQRQIFQAMFKKGWYKLPVADGQSVTDTFHQCQQRRAELPFPSTQGAQASAPPAQAAAGNPDQRVNQKVDEVLRQAENARVPVGQMRK